jgi:hypothetical protein
MYAKLLIKLTCKADNHVWTVGYRSYMETKTSIQKRVKSINNVRTVAVTCCGSVIFSPDPRSRNRHFLIWIQEANALRIRPDPI